MISFSLKILREALNGLRVLKTPRSSAPALFCVRVSGSETLVQFERTDLVQVLRYSGIGASTTATQVLIPYELLATAAKQADATGEIKITGGDSPSLAYAVDGMEVSFPFPARAVTEFPPVPAAEGDVIALPAGVLGAMQEALDCASTDPNRYLLNSVLLDAHAVVATNGHQLYRRNSLDLPIRDGGAIFPNSGVLEVLPDIEAELRLWKAKGGTPFAQITAGPWRWITRLVDGNYPDYLRVIPRIEEYPALVHLGEADAARIKSVLPKLPGFKDAKSPIVLQVGPEGASLHTAPGHPKVHLALEKSDVVCTTPMRVCFSAKVLLGALQTSSRELRVRDAVSPVMLTGYSRVHLWMPVQTKDPVPQNPEQSPSDTAGENPAPVVPVPENKPAPENSTNPPTETMVAQNNSQPAPETREDAPGVVASRAPAVSAQPTTIADAINIRLGRLRDLLREAGTEFGNIQALVKEQQRSHKALERDHESLKRNIRALREVPV